MLCNLQQKFIPALFHRVLLIARPLQSAAAPPHLPNYESSALPLSYSGNPHSLPDYLRPVKSIIPCFYGLLSLFHPCQDYSPLACKPVKPLAISC